MQVDAGRKQFQFAGLGSVVVWVDQRRTASYVDWSCDEAQTEEKVSFLTNSDLDMITVVGMLTEKGEKARHVTYVRNNCVLTLFRLNISSVSP